MKAANVEVEAFWPSLFAKLLQKVSVDDIVKGMSAAPVAGAAPAAGGAAPADADVAEEVRLLAGTQGVRAMRGMRMHALLRADGDSGCVDEQWRSLLPRRSCMLTHCVHFLCLLCCVCSSTVLSPVTEEGGGAGGVRGRGHGLWAVRLRRFFLKKVLSQGLRPIQASFHRRTSPSQYRHAPVAGARCLGRRQSGVLLLILAASLVGLFCPSLTTVDHGLGALVMLSVCISMPTRWRVPFPLPVIVLASLARRGNVPLQQDTALVTVLPALMVLCSRLVSCDRADA